MDLEIVKEEVEEDVDGSVKQPVEVGEVVKEVIV